MAKAIDGSAQRYADPTRLGTVEDVAGPSVRVKLDEGTATGLVFVRGEGYRVGQVGSFVRIPAGYVNLYGVVSQVGAGAAPGPPELAPSFGDRWLRIELVGEAGHRGKFERGISQYPSIGDAAHVVTESDLSAIYAPGDRRSYIAIGKVASARSIPAYIDLNRIVARHSAVVGSTGAGKSTTVASLLHLLADPQKFPSSRILLLDIHGEYARAFGNRARVFRINADATRGERPLHVPFWALSSDELTSITTGALAGGALAHFLSAITTMKQSSSPGGAPIPFPAEGVTPDTPLPFCIHKVWYDLHCLQYATHIEQTGKAQSRETWALERETANESAALGDAMQVKRPKFRQHKDEKGDPEKIRKSSQENLMRPATDALEGKLRDKRFDFLFRPGPWSVSVNGSTEQDLDELLQEWLGKDKSITVLDLSGVPPGILDDLVGAVLRIIYDAMFWGRALPAGSRTRPLLLVLEEAHSYLSAQSKNRAAAAARRIAKEGRKYGVGLMLVSQRPSEIDPTILSQCGTLIAMRLTNEADRSQIKSCASDNLEGLFSMLPILRTGEALIVGEAVGLPIRALIDPLPLGLRPDSDDPKVVVPTGPDGSPERGGGWTDPATDEDYAAIIRCWREQDALAVHSGLDNTAKRAATERK